MTATLQVKKGRPNYYVLIRYKDTNTGGEKQKWEVTDIPVKGNNKRKAEEKRIEVLADFKENNHRLSSTKDIFFTVFIEEWLENTRHSIASTTYDAYRLVIRNQIIPFYQSKKLKLKDISSSHIQEYMNFKLKKVTPNTVRKHLWIMSKCFESAIKQRPSLMTFNPIKTIDMPKEVKYTEAKYYTEKQIDELLNIAKGDIIEGIIVFALFYGMRRSEILGLKWDAINFENNSFAVKHTIVKIDKELHKKDSTKNKSSYRVLPLATIAVETLKRIKVIQNQYKSLQPNEYINEDYVFTYPDGRVLLPMYVTKYFKRFLTQNNLPVIRLHDLRHSTASYLLYLGFSMKEVQIWLGHGNIGTTMNLYTHLDMEDKRNIANTLNDKFKAFTDQKIVDNLHI